MPIQFNFFIARPTGFTYGMVRNNNSLNNTWTYPPRDPPSYIYPYTITTHHTYKSAVYRYIQVEAGDLFVNDSLHNWVPWFKISQLWEITFIFVRFPQLNKTVEFYSFMKDVFHFWRTTANLSAEHKCLSNLRDFAGHRVPNSCHKTLQLSIS